VCLDAVLWYHWLVWLEELHTSCISSFLILMVWPLSNAYIAAFTWYMGYNRDPKAPQPDKWKIWTLGSLLLTSFSEEGPPESTGEKNQWTLVAQNAYINQYELRRLTTSPRLCSPNGLHQAYIKYAVTWLSIYTPDDVHKIRCLKCLTWTPHSHDW